MVRFKKLDVENFGQFAGKRSFEFDGSLIGIFGPNGSGKSTIFACVRWLLTGMTQDSQQENITYGKKDASAKLTFYIDGTKAILSRELPSGKCTFIYGKETLTKVTEVKERILKLLKLDNLLHLDMLVAPQGTLHSMFSEAAQLEKRFHKLCGTAILEQKRQEINKELQRLPEIVINDAHNTEKEIEKLKLEIESYKNQITNLESKSLNISQSGYLQILESWKTQTRLSEEIKEKNFEINTLQSSIDANNKKLNSKQLEVQQLLMQAGVTSLDELDGDLQSIFSKKGELKRQQERWKEKCDYQSTLKVWEQTTYQLPAKDVAYLQKLKQQYNDYLGKISNLQGKLENTKSIIHIISTQEHANCPVCHSGICDKEKIKEEQTDVENDIKFDMEVLQKSSKNILKEIEELQAEHDQFNRKVEERKVRISSIQEELSKFDDVADVSQEIDKLNTEYWNKQHFQLNIKKEQDSLRYFEDETFKLNSRLESYELSLAKLKRELSKLNLNVTKEEISLIEIKLAEITQKLETLKQNKAILKEKESLLIKYSDAWKKIQKDIKLSKEVSMYKTLLNKVSKALHRDSLPRDMVQQKRRELNIKLNSYLNLFSLPFTIEIAEDMSMIAIFSDKRLSSKRLSVGQKITLAVAYTFAETDLFCKDVGFLVMDEPTPHVDDDNIANMGELFSKVAAAAKNSGKQIFLITHEQSMKDIVDSSIVLT
jgi:DNA repair exonuclease SbcCD ATPase subunit